MAFCTQCGKAIPESEPSCPDCAGKERPPSTIAGQETRWLMGDTPKPPSSGTATASMILGVFFFLLPCAFLAVVLGHMSLGEIKKSAGKLGGQGRAKAGLVLGYLGIALLPVILIGAAIAIPALMRARVSANEASAVGFVRRLNAAEIQYSQSHPDRGYTCNFRDLTEFGIPEGRVPPMTLNVEKDGYSFMLEGCQGGFRNAKPTSTYAIAAAPISVNTTGTHLFCSDQTAVIKSDVVRNSVEQCLAGGAPVQ